MNIPKQIVITTSEYIQIQTKLNLYIAKFGCKAVEKYLDSIPMTMQKKDGRHLGAYLVNKVCQEYKITQYALFERSGRKDLTEARQILCVLAEKYLQLGRDEISETFHRSRHFAKRLIGNFKKMLQENHPLDKGIIGRYRSLDSLMEAYTGFTPKTK